MGDLQVVSQYVLSQIALGRSRADVTSRQADSAYAKISRMRTLTMQDATALNDAIASGPWSDEHKLRLADAVDAM